MYQEFPLYGGIHDILSSNVGSLLVCMVGVFLFRIGATSRLKVVRPLGWLPMPFVLDRWGFAASNSYMGSRGMTITFLG